MINTKAETPKVVSSDVLDRKLMNLTIVYSTSRLDCRIQWFIDSLALQLGGNTDGIKVMIVDFHRRERFPTEGIPWFSAKMMPETFTYYHVEPKPTVWQGPHRLTKENWFDASNARNTALCFAHDGWIAYVDDLSVLMPGWLNAVREAMAGNYIALGAYKKVKKLTVKDGVPASFEEFPGGIDSRWNSGRDDAAVPATGDWMYGCSVAMPVEALLTVNGWPEGLCSGLGSEDYCCGIAMQNCGYTFKYDRRILTLESEELHHVEPAFKRSDYGVSPNDKSHAALAIARQSKRFPNHFDIRELRQKILAGERFPVNLEPRHEWWTKKPLSEL